MTTDPTALPKAEMPLLPCPFCGGEASEDRDWVFCSKCGVGCFYLEMGAARLDWNRRAPDARDERIRELLKVHRCVYPMVGKPSEWRCKFCGGAVEPAEGE